MRVPILTRPDAIETFSLPSPAARASAASRATSCAGRVFRNTGGAGRTTIEKSVFACTSGLKSSGQCVLYQRKWRVHDHPDSCSVLWHRSQSASPHEQATRSHRLRTCMARSTQEHPQRAFAHPSHPSLATHRCCAVCAPALRERETTESCRHSASVSTPQIESPEMPICAISPSSFLPSCRKSSGWKAWHEILRRLSSL